MNDQDPDERFKIEGDPEDALRGLLRDDPSAEPVDQKEQALDALRKALPAELALPGHKEKLMEAAYRAEASWPEIEQALSEAPR